MILEVLRNAEIPGLDDDLGGDDGRESWAYWVYRIYDCADRLLYIGCASDVVSRMQVHSCSWDNPASAAINCYGTRLVVSEPIIGFTAAREVERRAIADEAPLFNMHFNKGRSVLRSPEAWAAVEPMLLADRNEWIAAGGLNRLRLGGAA